MSAQFTVQVEQATVLLTVEQIVDALHQLDSHRRRQVLRALQLMESAEPDIYQLSIAALNSPAAHAVWDNPSDAATYDAIPWEPGDAVSTR